MSNPVLDNSRISKHLGQISAYKSTYDPGLLVSEPRANNRKHLNISDDNLPFVGFDTWNAYEVSGLTDSGLPVAGVAKIQYPCDSKYIVESKSIKLYFNSFNMHKCGQDAATALLNISQLATKDLSDLLQTNVQVCVQSSSVANNNREEYIFGEQYYTLEDRLHGELSDTLFETYQETPELLSKEKIDGDVFVGKYHSALLKSNCRVTSQPDWGDIYIHMSTNVYKPVDIDLLKYIISFRDECHFHEEICETVYARLANYYEPTELCVTCLYARRGGIDINPTRASHDFLLPAALADVTVVHKKTGKQ